MKKLYPFTKGIHIASSLVLFVSLAILFIAIPASGLLYASHVEHSYQLQFQSFQYIKPQNKSTQSPSSQSSALSPSSTQSNITSTVNTTSDSASSSSSSSLKSTVSTSNSIKVMSVPPNIKSVSPEFKNHDCNQALNERTATVYVSTKDRPLISLPIDYILGTSSYSASSSSLDSSQTVRQCQ